MAAPLVIRSTHGDQYAWAVGAAYQDGLRIYDPSAALADDPDIYTKLWRSSVAAAAIDQRTHMVAAKTWRLEPASDDPDDKALATILEALIRHVPRFTEARRLLAEADIVGCRYASITGGLRSLKVQGDDVERTWWVPGPLVDVDRRRFRAIAGRDAAKRVTVRWEMFELGQRQWIPVERPEHYVKHLVAAAESTLGYGRGLIESIQDDLYALTVVQKEALQGCKRWAQGLLTAKVHGGRDAATGLPNLTLLRSWAEELQRAQGENALAYDADDAIELVKGGMEGHQIAIDLIALLETRVRCRILGAEMPTAAPSSGTGTFAMAKVQENSTEVLVQGSQEMLDDTMTVDYVSFVHRVNRPVLADMGLSRARRPHFRTLKERVKDPKERADVIARLLAAGVRLKAEEVYAETGFTPPEEGDEVIEGRPPLDPSSLAGVGVGGA